ncbi:MAG: hypothetical protein ACFB15_31845, partial [Cyclobacteriaceae bacterium]
MNACTKYFDQKSQLCFSQHLVILLLILGVTTSSFAQFNLEQGTSYPFRYEFTVGGEFLIAWSVNASGLCFIYVAEVPDFEARQLTSYQEDDGQELSSVTISPDGQGVVYIRGGYFGSNWDDAIPVNPTSNPVAPTVELWSIPFA